MKTTIAELMDQSGVNFGTSGARGLVTAMSDMICYLYVRAFLQYLEQSRVISPGTRVALAGDFRQSTPRIIKACLKAVKDAGFDDVFCGSIPAPAVALYGIEEEIPAVMVTGSHIPDDRNGIKFNKPQGEILKADEAGIRDQLVTVPEALFDGNGSFLEPQNLPAEDPSARELYIRRFRDFFDSNSLRGMRIGLYQHSSVSRDLLLEILESLGAEVVSLGRSDAFVPVDTEAIRHEDIELASAWSQQYRLDSIVSTDGDGDRPLVSDEHGVWLRGDIAGILCAQFLQATAVVTPVSSNSTVERSGLFEKVMRTRIGSPYVISGMEEALRSGCKRVIGYEANGGLLQADTLNMDGRTLTALPTRDAVIVILSILVMSRDQEKSISALVATLPPRYTFSDRLKQFPNEVSRSRLAGITEVDEKAAKERIIDLFGDQYGQVSHIDTTDGVRITFSGGDVVHLRPSGNAPELRCYTEADSEIRAKEINATCMQILEAWRSSTAYSSTD